VSPAADAAADAAPARPPAIPARWLPFEWVVATRFLVEGRAQTISIVTGIAIGVAVIVFMSSLLSGLQANLVRRVLTGQAHIQLLPSREIVRPLRQDDPAADRGALVQAPPQRLKGLDQWQNVVAQVAAMPGVAVVAPVAAGSALALRGEASRAISLGGVDPETYFRVVPIPDKIVRGAARLTSSDILVGTELASDLGVGIGDRLRVANAAGTGVTLTITGIFDLGSKPANARTTYVTLRTAQSLLGLPGSVTAVDVTVHDVYAADRLADRIAAATGVQADSWIRTNEQIFTAVRAQTMANTAIRFFVALSVAFGIASVLVVSVVQRSREIGILRAMGISRGQVLRIFLLQGGLLGLGGSFAGTALGGIAVFGWQRIARNPDGTPLFPLVLEPSLAGLALLLATLTGLAAAFAPALRAARLDPVVAIRG